MTNKELEEIIELATKNYPIGTKYIPLHSDGAQWTNEDLGCRQGNSRFPPNNLGKGEPYPLLEVGIGYIYAQGKWATIIDSVILRKLSKARDIIYGE